MENKIKVNLWTDYYANELKNTSILNFNPMNGVVLRMANHQYDEIFNLLIQGKTIKVANLELINKTLNQAINEAESEDMQTKRVSIFTSDDYETQNVKFEALLKSNNKVYLTFGLLDYFEDNRMIIKSAPLVFMPIIIENIDNGKSYQIKNINHELLLNEALINRLNDSRHIDLSFPLENDFSLIEYLTYVATKVRNNHFSVNNGCFITNFDLDSFYYWQDFTTNKEAISSLPLVKSISYLNSEFFNLNKSNSSRLDNHILSLLDLDNDEYKILKRINVRENMVIKTNSLKNKKHLISNIINDFLLNNRNIIIAYDDNDSYQQIKEMIDEFKLKEFALDLSTKTTNKSLTLKRLTSVEKLEFDIKLLDQNKINETVDTFYLLKNNFKKLINSLRKSNEPMKLSINRAIFEYFSLNDYPLINSTIPNVDLIDENKIKEYLDAITTFVKSLESLGCNYIDHPFYGFNNLTMTQAQYLEFKDKIISLSNEFDLVNKAFFNLKEKYNLPIPDTLKEMKCVLNIISLIPDCISLNQEYFTIEDQDKVLQELTYHNELFIHLAELRNKLISIYDDRIFLINHEELNQHLQNKPLTRKVLKIYSQYFNKRVKIDEAILTHLAAELDEYYSLDMKVNEIIKNNEIFSSFYNEGVYDLTKIEDTLKLIKKFNENCAYLGLTNKEYSYKSLSIFSDESILSSLQVDRKKAQIGFNHILNLINYIQKYFDEKVVDFSSISLLSVESKIKQASKNFSSINNYLDFYLTYRKLNKIIPSLGDELLKHPQTNSYLPMFMKRFYFDFASTLIKGNPMFKNYNDNSFILNMEHYQDYNQTRLEMISALIKNNIKVKLQNNNITLKSIETPYLNNLLNNDIKVLPLNKLLSQAKVSFLSLYPILIVPVKEVPSLLTNPDFHFDLAMIFANENLLVRDTLPTSVRSNQTIVIDYNYINSNQDDHLIRESSENFIYSASQSLSLVNFVSASYKANVLSGNNIDTSLKRYIIDKLNAHNFMVSKDVVTNAGTIDILVKVPNSLHPTAIILDRLNYYSLESAIESFSETQAKIENLGFAYYRLITSIFFLNEEEEINKLIDFIIKNTVKEKTTKKVSKIRPLVEVLFNLYQPIESIYISIPDKKEKPNIQVMMELLTKCAPVTKREIIDVVGSDAISTLATLQAQRMIKISNDFIFINDQNITFKRVSINMPARDLDLVSNEEISVGIKQILTQKSFSQDEMIKLILSTLGLKKMNHNQYFRIQNIIGDLLEDSQILIRDGILYISE